MASLGQLVAGVAHEINTPVGIGVTAASHLDEAIKHTEKLVEQNTIKKSELLQFLDDSRESSQLILRNLSRASELIRNFKSVAVDQSIEEKREINLNTYIYEVFSSLLPKFKHSEIELAYICKQDININTYPGSIAQIITNLVLNAKNHAFQEDQSGKIFVEAFQEDETVTLRVTDDGCGVAEEIRDKIFDPFVTTKRNQGGTGLGLNIVYNIVKQKLNGFIEVTSKIGAGTIFTITFPKNL